MKFTSRVIHDAAEQIEITMALTNAEADLLIDILKEAKFNPGGQEFQITLANMIYRTQGAIMAEGGR